MLGYYETSSDETVWVVVFKVKVTCVSVVTRECNLRTW